MVTKEELIAFELEIKDLFLAGRITAPIHLAGGNEDELISLFKGIKPQDWIVSTYRSHYHALLKGIEADWLRDEILQGRSMHIMSRGYRFITSSIVAGGVPISVGLALGIKLRGEDSRVWCFIGDMGARTGCFVEGSRYAANHHLPVTFVVENNGFSVNTPTGSVWGDDEIPEIVSYDYKRVYPHAGVGQWVKF